MEMARVNIEVDVPEKVDAGAKFELLIRVVTDPNLDLTDKKLQIGFSQDAHETDEVTLTACDGKATESEVLVCTAPGAAGQHVWWATLPAGEAQGTEYPETTVEFKFKVTPAHTSVVVWDVPSAVVRGESFRAKVGVKASSEVNLTDMPVEILDLDGSRVARGHLGAEPWKGTAALYFTEITLAAPQREAVHRFVAHVPGSDAEPARATASSEFRVRVVPEPECAVRVKVVGDVDGAPLGRLHVRMHPYQTTTDEDGIAELRVPKGKYDLHVSGRRFVPYHYELEVDSDAECQVGLVEEVPYEEL